ncbi:MAG: acyl-CoA thioester hydrolase [Gammaproteobacteria bacterium]|jgi:acyl-CoA thioester hydrolase
MNYTHRLKFEVRDYECDMQGVVNNGVYQSYLEHARHEFLLSRGISFAQMATDKINLVVIRAELDYRDSLKSGDKFEVCSNIQQVSTLRFEFLQDIYRASDLKLMLQAKITGTALNERGRPFKLEVLSLLFET